MSADEIGILLFIGMIFASFLVRFERKESYAESAGTTTEGKPRTEPVTSVAVLPVILTEENTDLERWAASVLARALSEYGVNRVVCVEELIWALYDAGIEEHFAAFSRDYQNTGNLNNPMLEKLALATGEQNFLYAKVDYAWTEYDSGDVFQELHIQAENWDARLGDVSQKGRAVAEDYVTWFDLTEDKRQEAPIDELLFRAASEVARLFY